MQGDRFHVVTVGWDHDLIQRLCVPISAKSNDRFSHIVHPRYSPQDWPKDSSVDGIHFFRNRLRQDLPEPDHQFLASLEQEGIPTIHNMILGDRVVSKLEYLDATRYATFVSHRLIDLFNETKPSVIIGAFDAIHGGLAFAVARHLNIPWFALHFSVIPSGLACFCDRMSPAARVSLGMRSAETLQSLAETSLRQFERRVIEAPAFIAPKSLSRAGTIGSIPGKLSAVTRTIRKSRVRDFLRFTDNHMSFSVFDVLKGYRRADAARKAIAESKCLTKPPTDPYILFGLHMQPESSIDVWAPFFSNQMWVIELLSRSVPPTHKILVKIHKSDISRHSKAELELMRAYPDVELVEPFANTRDFIRQAELLVAIQGTMGLEAALLGKPVIMLGDSPATLFPSVSQISEIQHLPRLVKRKLAESRPTRKEIVDAYAAYLSPFMPASHNDWSANIDGREIDSYVKCFDALRRYVSAGGTRSAQSG